MDALEFAASALIELVTQPDTPPAMAPMAPITGSPPPAMAPDTAPLAMLDAIPACPVVFVVAIETWLLVSVVDMET